MTTRYRVEYALKSHRRDQLIEWVKGLLISPFVLFSQPAGDFEAVDAVFAANSAEVRRRYAEIMLDIEGMIEEHIGLQASGSDDNDKNKRPSKLQLLVPTVGYFFTPLPLKEAFLYQDSRRHISSRRLVAPSFNDIRLTLNTAQMMALTKTKQDLRLVTFDGDLTLYEDGQNLEDDSPIVPGILQLLRRDVCVGIVTAAGYDVADRYHDRLHGLLDAVHAAADLTPSQKSNLLVVGGEANFVFAYDPDADTAPAHLSSVSPDAWMPSAMRRWPAADMDVLLDLAEGTLRACVERMQLPAQVLRKERAVGIVPHFVSETSSSLIQIPRESLEEIVLTVQRRLEISHVGRAGRVPFCAFNGGRDVFVDIGDKSWGVQICQHALLSTSTGTAGQTLHVGDQFLSAGANDFRARRAATTAWVANPSETEALLNELLALLDREK